MPRARLYKDGAREQTRHGMNTVGNVMHLIEIANRFCAGCESHLPGKPKTFPGCKEGVDISALIPVGIIYTDELLGSFPPECLRIQRERGG